MKRLIALLTAGVLAAIPLPAQARERKVSVGNYYFQDDETKARNPIVVDEGDQIEFTIRAAAYPPHTIVIPAYDIDSEDEGTLLLFDTYRTPPLDRPGTFLLFCRPHRDKGHETTLRVRAKASPTSAGTTAPPPKNKSSTGSQTTPTARATSTATPTRPAVLPTAPGSPASSPQETAAPAGIGRATDRRRLPPDPNSLAGMLGRRFGGDLPWTTALWQALLAAVPIAAAVGYALRRERRRRTAAPSVEPPVWDGGLPV